MTPFHDSITSQTHCEGSAVTIDLLMLFNIIPFLERTFQVLHSLKCLEVTEDSSVDVEYDFIP